MRLQSVRSDWENGCSFDLPCRWASGSALSVKRRDVSLADRNGHVGTNYGAYEYETDLKAGARVCMSRANGNHKARDF